MSNQDVAMEPQDNVVDAWHCSCAARKLLVRDKGGPTAIGISGALLANKWERRVGNCACMDLPAGSYLGVER